MSIVCLFNTMYLPCLINIFTCHNICSKHACLESLVTENVRYAMKCKLEESFVHFFLLSVNTTEAKEFSRFFVKFPIPQYYSIFRKIFKLNFLASSSAIMNPIGRLFFGP